MASVISEICSDDANIIFGTSVDESYADEISVTVVATSFDVSAPPPQAAGRRGSVAMWQTLDRPATSAVGVGQKLSAGMEDAAFNPAVSIAPPDPFLGSAPATRKPRFWSRF